MAEESLWPRPGLSLQEEPPPPPPSPPFCFSEVAEPAEAELSLLGLARTKTRSYGSTAATVAAPLAERYVVEHPVSRGDTLQGIALKYGVTMEQIKRANKLFTNDCIFLKKTLNIPIMSEKPSVFNGLNTLESPETEPDSPSGEEGLATVQQDNFSPSPPESNNPFPPPEELSAKDFLHRLDLQIKMSKQAAKKLKPEDHREDSENDSYATSSYQQ